MPAITTRQTLFDAVTAYLGRSDQTANYDLLLNMAEEYIERRVRHGEWRDTMTIATADDNVLPPLVKSLRAIRITSPTGEYPLTLVTSAHLEEQRAAAGGAVGIPRFAAIVEDTLSVAPTPAASYSATVVFEAGLATLGTSPTSTNTTLNAHPDLYLYAMLREACEFLEDPRVDRMAARVDDILHWIRVDRDERIAHGSPRIARLPTSF